MEFKVREATELENKSAREVEEALLQKAEEKQQISEDEETEPTEPNTEPTTEESSEESSGLSEEDVLSYIKNRYNKEITSVEQLFEERETQEELPEDVKAYYEYRKKTGRGIEDYAKLNRDFDSMDDKQLLKEYLLQSGEALDQEDVEILLEDYSWDEELDEERDVKKKKLAYKKAIVEAKKYFNDQKEMYKKPLESSTANMSPEDKKELEAYKQYLAEAETIQQESERKREWFLKKTDDVFNDFKGFDFKIGDETLTYNPGDASKIKESQLNPQSFIKKFLNDDGLLEDAQGYHKSLAVAMNPERFAKFFYEQGKSDAIDGTMRKMKNVDMDDRRVPQTTNKDGLKIRAVNPSSGRGLKIKSRKS